MRFVQISFILFLPVTAFLSAGCNDKTPTGTPSGQPAQLIKISHKQFDAENMQLGNTKPHTFTRIYKTNGIVTASPQSKADVYSYISGIVKYVFVNPGTHVRKGQILCTLESRAFIDLQQQYLESLAGLKAVENDYRRIKKLYDQNISSQKDFIAIESSYKMLNAKIKALKAQLKILNVSIGDLEEGQLSGQLAVHSPIGGYIAEQNCNVGQSVNTEELLMKVIDNKDLQLHFFVYQESVGKLKKGQLINIYTADDPDNIYTATISSIGKAIDPETKSIDCIAIPEKRLRPVFIDGMYFQVEVKTDTVTAPGLPAGAVVKTGGKQYVLVKEKEDENGMYFRKTAVNTGILSDGFIEIRDNEPLNDVLVKGVYYFHTQ